MWIILGAILVLLGILGLAHVIAMVTWLAVLILVVGVLMLVWDRMGSLPRHRS